MTQQQQMQVMPVILCGGNGSRLWPLSRRDYPKQFLTLHSDKSLLQQTLLRTQLAKQYRAPMLICHEMHRFLVAEQLRILEVAPEAILLEPEAKTTAMAMAVSALRVMENAPEAMLLFLPADHIVHDIEAFHQAVEQGVAAAEKGYIVTFGIAPDAPETGYGYIQQSDETVCESAFHVLAFHEKPDVEKAEQFLDEGNFSWNSGMFLATAKMLVTAFKAHAPKVLAAAEQALINANHDLDFYRLGKTGYHQAPSLPFDVAVMECTDKAAVIPVDMGWSDVGNWNSLWQLANKDAQGNAVTGDVQLIESQNNYVHSEAGLVAAVGVENLVIVNTADAVLVATQESAQQVKQVVARLEQEQHPLAESHRIVYRPWGAYETLYEGTRSQVKRITVKPGARLSLQKHFHRAEHWVVVHGTALVTREGEQFMVQENASTYIPIGATHRIENPGKIPLTLIEVQSGSYLGEDDIERFEDDYGREPEGQLESLKVG